MAKEVAGDPLLVWTLWIVKAFCPCMDNIEMNFRK
jgi:hypothetical protein